MTDWFKDWFSSDFYLSVYSHRNDADAENFLNNILRFIKIPENGNVLDAACGSGRHSIIMAEKGYSVTAFDLSAPLLNIGIQKARALNMNIDFFNGDLRYINLKKKFSLILNLFTSFGYFNNDSENFAFINSAYEMLENKGYFVFDYLNEEFVRKSLVSKSEKSFNGLKIEEKRRISEGRVMKSIFIEKEGENYRYEESVQLYSFSQIKEHFGKIGFQPVKIFGSYECEPFIPDKSERLIIIFQK